MLTAMGIQFIYEIRKKVRDQSKWIGLLKSGRVCLNVLWPGEVDSCPW